MRKSLLRPENVRAYLEIVESICAEWFDEDEPFGPWFRGQKKDSWPLCPKLYRDYGGFRSAKNDEVEDEIREDFIVRAPIFSEVKPAGDNDWEWYFLMQHYGSPTRLLDWTEGALIGLYFAIKDNPGHYDAAVWVLEPFRLNGHVLRRHEIFPPSASLIGSAQKLVKPWLPNRFTRMRGLPRNPIAVYPTHIARRISTQRSCFTVHGTDEKALDRLQAGKWSCLVKISIPSYCVGNIRSELETCGIDEVTIFPDLDGLSRSIAGRWRESDKRLPHDGVYTRLQRSKIDPSGVGVFAIADIKRGTPLFLGDNEEIMWVDHRHVKKLQRGIRKLYDDFAIFRAQRYGCPPTFNRLTMSWYLNEPTSGMAPNVRCDPDTYDFFALRNIRAGEELTVDYKTYSDSPSKAVPRKSRKKR